MIEVFKGLIFNSEGGQVLLLLHQFRVHHKVHPQQTPRPTGLVNLTKNKLTSEKFLHLRGTGLSRPFSDYNDLPKMKSSASRYNKIVNFKGKIYIGFFSLLNDSLLLNKAHLKLKRRPDGVSLKIGLKLAKFF